MVVDFFDCVDVDVLSLFFVGVFEWFEYFLGDEGDYFVCVELVGFGVVFWVFE